MQKGTQEICHQPPERLGRLRGGAECRRAGIGVAYPPLQAPPWVTDPLRLPRSRILLHCASTCPIIQITLAQKPPLQGTMCVHLGLGGGAGRREQEGGRAKQGGGKEAAHHHRDPFQAPGCFVLREVGSRSNTVTHPTASPPAQRGPGCCCGPRGGVHQLVLGTR